MPLPRILASFNRRVTNRLFSLFAGWLPPFAVVEHRGRSSGRRYRTVVWSFPIAGGMVIALTYGASADWVRNVLAAGSCRLRWAGAWRQLTAPELLEGPAALRLLPPVLRPALWLLSVHQALRLRWEQAGGAEGELLGGHGPARRTGAEPSDRLVRPGVVGTGGRPDQHEPCPTAFCSGACRTGGSKEYQQFRRAYLPRSEGWPPLWDYDASLKRLFRNP
jgi:deazaflavin-dependent oxidoreductase (nitroreductase family)